MSWWEQLHAPLMTFQPLVLVKRPSVPPSRCGAAAPPCRLGLLPRDSLELTAIAVCYQGRQKGADKHCQRHDMTAPPAK